MTIIALALATACSSDGDDGAPADADGPPVPSVTVPPERLTPFCEAMIELADRIESDPPDDLGELILAAYLDILDEVPPEIENEFRAVIADLQDGEPAPTTTTSTATSTSSGTPSTSTPADGTATGSTSLPLEDFDAEGRLPGDSPSERVSDYVLFTCRGSDNNPGPPPTEPLEDVVVDDEA